MTQAFNLSQFANYIDPTTYKVGLSTGVTGLLPVANGGTNKSSFANNSLVAINSTGGFTELTGSANQIVQHNGTTWAAQALIAGGFVGAATFTSNGTWTVPTGTSKALVQVYGAGGNGLAYSNGGTRTAAFGGGGAYACVLLSGLTSGTTYTITIAAGGSAGVTSFGSLIVCNGGTNAYNPGASAAAGTNGSATISSGTVIVNSTLRGASASSFSDSSANAAIYQVGIITVSAAYAGYAAPGGLLDCGFYGRAGYASTTYGGTTETSNGVQGAIAILY